MVFSAHAAFSFFWRHLLLRAGRAYQTLALVNPWGGDRHRRLVYASLGLRLYLHFFNNYSVTYGGLGAVIILLTWFYLTGLTLLLGAEINSQIEAAAAAKLLRSTSTRRLS